MSVYTRGNARQSLIDTAAFRAVSQISTLLGYVVMVRGMTKEDFGVFNLLYAFIPVVGTLASLGLEQTLRRYQPEYLSAGNTAGAQWLVRFVASARFGTSVIFLGAILLAWNLAAPLFKLTPYRGEFALFCLLVVLHFQAQILQLSFGSHMLHRYGVGATALLSCAKLLGYGLFVWQNSLTLERAILVDTAAYAISYVFLRRAYNKTCLPEPSVQAYRPSPDERKRLVKYGLYNNFNDAGTLILNSDSFFIAAFIDPISVGIYAFYNRLNMMISNLLPVRLFENVVQPLFFAMPGQDADRRSPEYFSLLLNMNLVLQWPVLAFCTAYHVEIVQVLFGGKFVEDSWLLPLIIGFATLNTFSTPATLVAQYEEKSGVILLSKIFLIYNVAALLVLLPVAGLYGAAVATGSAQFFKNLFIWWHVRRRAAWVNAARAFASGVLLWGLVVGACYALKQAVAMPAFLQLLAGGVICSAATLVHLRSPAISASDRRILSSILGGKEARILRLVGLSAPAPADGTVR